MMNKYGDCFIPGTFLTQEFKSVSNPKSESAMDVFALQSEF